MSAYICSDRQFQTIAEYAAEYMGANAMTVADVLKRENVRSVNTRYNEKIRFSKVAFKASNSLASSGFNNADIVELCRCVNYQSCENNDWEESAGYTILSMITEYARQAAERLNMGESDLWGI